MNNRTVSDEKTTSSMKPYKRLEKKNARRVIQNSKRKKRQKFLWKLKHNENNQAEKLRDFFHSSQKNLKEKPDKGCRIRRKCNTHIQTSVTIAYKIGYAYSTISKCTAIK